MPCCPCSNRAAGLLHAGYAGAYCWVVDREQPAPRDRVVGVALEPARTEYQLHKGALSGDIIIGFVPGVGITRFTGVHRAVRWEADLQLVEYRPGER